ncbi:class I SAM-dependent methyltransferase [Methylomarinum sp. Ch1-1]|uniref:Class I SAM-dependent methyltransferase n=1 Tax=Methylomarinum roseum TaxID=3067653 RepID=A0AAU7P0M9_9GAMM|nr:class I SAM-dependent methyltransferase [Methylomarinum sp. Ch1-1]MDP4521457.1 class I SAM-dependent methyltransferase [Methylomarinum sp. Ch1-1]
MKRRLEPELMEDPLQAEVYAAADFAEADSLMLQAFNEAFPEVELQGPVLDLGCGPGNMAFRFAERFPRCQVIGVDGSAAMLAIADQRKKSRAELIDRIRFLQGIIPKVRIPAGPYAAIISNSFLHHLHRPEVLWGLISHYAQPGCQILIMDLYRPDSPQQAQGLVEKYASSEPEVLRRDFYHSLLAALTPDEVKQQLATVGLGELVVRKTSDRHMIIVGQKS